MASILVVDDDAHELARLREILEKAGHLVTGATDGRQALERIRSTPFDVVFVELYMEGFDGLEFLVTSRTQGADLPIILMADPTRRSYLSVGAVGAHLGAAGSLSKPVDERTIEAALTRILPA